jgi:serine/threonine protein kinase
MTHCLDAGHRWLFEHAGILHRDISLDNLMLRRERDKVYGILNDMDLAVSIGVTSTSSKQRTGTKPFMAINLLRPGPPVHMYRHDLESMFYVLVWITSRFNNGEEITEPPLQEWADLGGVALVKEKNSFFMSLPPRRTAQFESFGRWVVPLQTMFRDGFSSWTKHLSEISVAGPQTSSHPHFEDETLGGLVTFDKFQAILDAKLL